MSGDFTICVGTVGGGIFYSRDGGDSWTMSTWQVPVPPWAGWVRIRSIDVCPQDDNVMIAGSDVGLYRSIDKGAHWAHVPSPADDPYIHVWEVKYHPTRPGTIFMGFAPGAIYRSRDNGVSWQRLPVPVAHRCIVGSTHVLDIVFDPRDPDIIWSANEASGILRSKDGGDTWVHLPAPGPTVQNSDIHGIVALPEGKIFCTTPDGVWNSSDEGKTYKLHKFPIEWPPEPAAVAVNVETYCRGITNIIGNPHRILVACGDYVPGKVGGVRISDDGGSSWRSAAMDVTPNSTMYVFATHKTDPNLVVASSNYGYTYISRDAGETWKKVPREFGEIRGLVWAPN